MQDETILTLQCLMLNSETYSRAREFIIIIQEPQRPLICWEKCSRSKRIWSRQTNTGGHCFTDLLLSNGTEKFVPYSDLVTRSPKSPIQAKKSVRAIALPGQPAAPQSSSPWLAANVFLRRTNVFLRSFEEHSLMWALIFCSLRPKTA